MKKYVVGGHGLLVIHGPSGYYALQNKCTHMGGDLSCMRRARFSRLISLFPFTAGKLVDIEDHVCIKCPLHGFCYDIVTGKELYCSRRGEYARANSGRSARRLSHRRYADAERHQGQDQAAELADQGRGRVLVGEAAAAQEQLGSFPDCTYFLGVKTDYSIVFSSAPECGKALRVRSDG